MTTQSDTTQLLSNPIGSNITKAKETVRLLFKANKQHVTPCLIGGPGVGKSSIFKQIKSELNFDYLIDCRLSQHDNTDIKGVPQILTEGVYSFVRWVSPDFMPLKGSKWDGLKGILLFDEINRADSATMQSVFECVWDRTIGGRPMCDDCRIAAAGNFGYEDGTDVFDMDSALQNRMNMIYITQNVVVKDWLNWARESNIHPIILNFIEQHPTYLYLDSNMVKNHPRHGIVTGRSWEILSNILYEYPNEELDIIKFTAEGLIYSALPSLIELCEKRNKLKPIDVIKNYPTLIGQLSKLERAEKYGLANEISFLIVNDLKDDLSTIPNVSRFFTEIINDVDHQTVFLEHISKNIAYLDEFCKANPALMDNNSTISHVITKCLFSSQG